MMVRAVLILDALEPLRNQVQTDGASTLKSTEDYFTILHRATKTHLKTGVLMDKLSVLLCPT